MNQIDYLAQKIEVIKAIPDDKIISPGNVPMKVYIQEAEFMYKWCQPDKDKLIANHLDWSLVEDIPARVKALKELQSLWKDTKLRHQGLLPVIAVLFTT